MAQPLQPLFADKKYDHALFCLFFIGGCAILGMFHSYLKKLEPTTTEQKKPHPSRKKVSNDELKQEIANLNEAHKETKNFELSVKQVLARQEKNINDLTKKCDELTEKYKNLKEQNKQLGTTINNIFLQQTIEIAIFGNYKQNILNSNRFLQLNSE